MAGSLVKELIKKHGGSENEVTFVGTSLEGFAEALAKDEELTELRVQEVFTAYKRGMPTLFLEILAEVGGRQQTISIKEIHMPQDMVREHRATLYSKSPIGSISSLLPQDRYSQLSTEVRQQIVDAIESLVDKVGPLPRASFAYVEPNGDAYTATRQPNGEWVYPQRMASSSDSPIVTR